MKSTTLANRTAARAPRLLPHAAAGRRSACLLLLLLSLLPPSLHAERLLIAVASNFTAPLQELARRFESETGHEVAVSSGASGRFYAQISRGAPFQLFFSADQETPLALVEAGLAEADSLFTYARGRLVLWSVSEGLELADGELLRQSDYRRLALANPLLAPYGEAAVEVLEALGLAESSRERRVLGENIAQTFQFVSSSNADFGFVALSQLSGPGRDMAGSAWLVPEQLHRPIRQDAVLIDAGCEACAEFLDFVASAAGRAVIASFGYEIEDSE